MSIQTEFLRKFTYSILMNSRTSRMIVKKEVINADLVPHVSEAATIQHLLVQKVIPSSIQKSEQPRLSLVKLVSKIIPTTEHKPLKERKFTIPVTNISPSTGEYGKITALIKDPTVTLIQCEGAEQNVLIIRAGQRQFTKISLNPVEIKELLDKIALKAKIPLLDGVFRAAVDNFIVNAVVSSMVGSRFLIKKQTPYSLIEPAGF